MAPNGKTDAEGVSYADTSAQVQAQATPQKPLTPEEALQAQMERVQELGIRTSSLIRAVADTYQQFLWESTYLFSFLSGQIQPAENKEPNDNRATDSPTTQATS